MKMTFLSLLLVHRWCVQIIHRAPLRLDLTNSLQS